MANHPVTARIGMVNFINTAPLYEVWQRTVQRPEWQITEAVPSVLNNLLNEGKLDLEKKPFRLKKYRSGRFLLNLPADILLIATEQQKPECRPHTPNIS